MAPAPDLLPLFPLPDQVLLPGVPAPFRIFEPRYLALIADLKQLPEDERWLAVPRLARGWENNYEGNPAFHPVVAPARLVHVRDLAQGQYLIVVQGEGRVVLSEETSHLPYRIARSEPLPDEPAEMPAAALAGAVDHLITRVRLLARRNGAAAEQIDQLAAAIGPGPELIERLAAVLITDPDVRQSYLECLTLDGRVTLFRQVVEGALGPGAQGWNFSRN